MTGLGLWHEIRKQAQQKPDYPRIRQGLSLSQ